MQPSSANLAVPEPRPEANTSQEPLPTQIIAQTPSEQPTNSAGLEQRRSNRKRKERSSGPYVYTDTLERQINMSKR